MFHRSHMPQSPLPNIFTRPAPVEPVNLIMEERLILSLFQQGRLQEAQVAAASLTQRAPQHGFGWKALGLILSHLNRKEDALPAMQRAARLMPRDAETFNNLGGLFEEGNQLEFAQACYEHAASVNPKFQPAQTNLDRLLYKQQKPEELIRLLKRELAKDPTDEYTRHRIDMLERNQTDAAPKAYVTKLFDHYADYFDQHLQETLDYRAPAEVVALLDRHVAPGHAWDTLDLGCGTGLVGVALGERPRSLVGVDLSEKMLDRAREKGCYQSLACQDVLEYLKEAPTAAFDTIIAAEVFVYMGKITDVVAEVHRVLKPGGLLAFTVEDLASQPDTATDADHARGYRLEPSGRYSHADAHLRDLAQQHGLQIVRHESSNLRRHQNHHVQGQLVLWQR